MHPEVEQPTSRLSSILDLSELIKLKKEKPGPLLTTDPVFRLLLSW
jgi:hypothetical protein